MKMLHDCYGFGDTPLSDGAVGKSLSVLFCCLHAKSCEGMKRLYGIINESNV